jgi:kynurenine formamidase
MTKLIDLSQEIKNDMAVHPYDEQVKLYQDKFLQEDKYNNFRLEIGMHAGTHIDTPMHLTDRETFINDISLDNFVGKGCLLDVRGESMIEYKEKYSDIVNEDDIVLLFTGYNTKFGTEEYYKNHPEIDKELANFFIERKVKMIGIDLPSPDSYPFEIHKKLFENNVLIIENLTNLAKLQNIDEFEVEAFPLHIRAEASPARVVARKFNHSE